MIVHRMVGAGDVACGRRPQDVTAARAPALAWARGLPCLTCWRDDVEDDPPELTPGELGRVYRHRDHGDRCFSDLDHGDELLNLDVGQERNGWRRIS